MEKSLASQIQTQLLRYPILERGLTDPSIKSFKAYGFCAIDLSGILVSKNVFDESNDALISLTEVQPIEDCKYEYKVKNTDYMAYGDSTYSDIEQNTFLFSSGTPSESSPLYIASKKLAAVKAEFELLESLNAEDDEMIDCENRISDASRAFFSVYDQATLLDRIVDQFDQNEQNRLVSKLGTLVLDTF